MGKLICLTTRKLPGSKSSVNGQVGDIEHGLVMGLTGRLTEEGSTYRGVSMPLRLQKCGTFILSALTKERFGMKWSEVRERFPNQFVLVEELASHIENDRVLVDDVAVVRAVPDDEATKTLMQCKDKLFVYHTNSDSVVIELRRRPGLRGRFLAN